MPRRSWRERRRDRLHWLLLELLAIGLVMCVLIAAMMTAVILPVRLLFPHA